MFKTEKKGFFSKQNVLIHLYRDMTPDALLFLSNLSQ